MLNIFWPYMSEFHFEAITSFAWQVHQCLVSLTFRYESVKEEFEEFQSESRDLELELEMQLEQAEKRGKEITAAHESLRVEHDSFRVSVTTELSPIKKNLIVCSLSLYQEKSERARENLILQLTQLQDEYARVKSERDDMHRYIRDLEQVNDDLERTKRYGHFFTYRRKCFSY